MSKPIADVLAEIATVLQSDQSETLTTQSIVDRGLEFVPAARHLSLTVRQGKGHQTLAATSDVAVVLDAAQYALGEGPCVETAADGEWHRSGDLRLEPRWPRWAPTAVERGVLSMLSIRLLADGEPFGALNFYGDQPDRFASTEQVEEAQLFGVHAAHALVRARLVSNLETALTSRHDIGVAQGILMVRYGLTADQAFAALKRVSHHGNVKLRDVAAEVVRQGSLPD